MSIKPIKRITKVCAKGPVRWSHLCYLDARTQVGSDAWYAAHPGWRQRKLSAWRALHKLRSHPEIHRLAAKLGYDVSSDMQLREMIRLVFKLSGRKPRRSAARRGESA